jgi:hypothetical protein
MRFYCQNCGSVLILTKETAKRLRDEEGPGGMSPIGCEVCNNNLDGDEFWMERLSDFEAPEQYEARTGKPWPDDAPVWYRFGDGDEWSVDCFDYCKELCGRSKKQGTIVPSALCVPGGEKPPPLR